MRGLWQPIRMLRAYVVLAGVACLVVGPLSARRGEAARSGRAEGVRARYVAGQIFVKLTGHAARVLKDARIAGQALHEVPLSPELDQLMRVYGATEITPAFRGFEIRDGSGNVVAIETMEEHVARVKAGLGEEVGQLPPPAKAVDLTRIYKVKLAEDADVIQAVSDFSRCDGVECADPNYIRELYFAPNDPFWASYGSWQQSYDDLWGLKRIGCEDAWDLSTGKTSGGESIIVAVIDTGVWDLHSDLRRDPPERDNIWVNDIEDLNHNGRIDKGDFNHYDDDGNGYVDDVIGWDFCDHDKYPRDFYGHGTHCAGTIAAVGNNALGIVGVAFEAKVMPLKVSSDEGQFDDEALSWAIVYAADEGARVLSCSWGGGPESSALTSAIHYAYYYRERVLVFSAGNSPRDGRVAYPASLQETIAVGATNHGDPGPNGECKSAFSSWGPALDVMAPGGDCLVGQPHWTDTDILSLRAPGTDLMQGAGPEPGIPAGECVVQDTHYRMRGTSMSCPHVSGLAALILARNPEFKPEQVRQAIITTAQDLWRLGVDDAYGYGRINAADAVALDVVGEAIIALPLNGQINPWEPQGYVEVYGTAKSDSLWFWLLEWSNTDGRTWNYINHSYDPVEWGTLGLFYPQETPDGEYVFRLSLWDYSWQYYEDRVSTMGHAAWHGFFGDYDHVNTAPALADIDPSYPSGQPGLEIAIGSEVDLPWWWPSAPFWGLFLVDKGDHSSWDILAEINVSHSSAAVDDVDPGTNGLEIVVGSSEIPYDTGGVYCFLSDGTQKWAFEPEGERFWTSPALGDLHPDISGLETAIVSEDVLYVLNKSGDVLWDWSPLGAAFGCCPTLSDLGDIDGTGLKIILPCPFRANWTALYVFYRTDSTWATYWCSEPLSGTAVEYSSPAVANLYGFPADDIVFGGTDGKLYAFCGQGTVLWTYATGGPIRSSPAIADLCTDPSHPQGKEIVFGSDDGYVYCLHYNGTLCWRFQTSAPVSSSPAIADLDTSAAGPEVAIGSAYRKLYILHGNDGSPARVFRAWGEIYGSPSIADVNRGTAGLEVVFGTDTGYVTLINSDPADPCPPGATPWPTFQHDNARTGFYDGWY